MAEPDITVTLNVHREGALLEAALASLKDLVNAARGDGIGVETQAILDRPDDPTRQIVDKRGQWLDRIEEISLGDLGLSRNAGTHLARGRFLTFLDGDDLWGDQWLRAAFGAASNAEGAIWHPAYLYVFGEGLPSGAPEASLRIMPSSDALGFNPDLLLFGNLWSANTFAAKETYLRFPYRGVDRSRGLGVEDWSWNLETLLAGIPHRAVAETVHLVRKRSEGSLDRQNTMDALLPYLPSFAWTHRSI